MRQMLKKIFERHKRIIGSSYYKDKYVNEKVNGWVKELEKLRTIAVTQPQAA